MISNLPISGDQEVVCVVMDSMDAWEDYSIYPMVKESIAVGIIDDYGTLDEITDRFYQGEDNDGTFSVRTYNDADRPVLFVLKNVWDKIVEFSEKEYKQSIDCTLETDLRNDYSKKLVELYELVDKLRELKDAPIATDAAEGYKKLKEQANKPTPKLYREWVAVRCFLRKVRKCYVSANAFSGCQHTELDAHKFLNNVVAEQITIQEKEFTYE